MFVVPTTDLLSGVHSLARGPDKRPAPVAPCTRAKPSLLYCTAQRLSCHGLVLFDGMWKAPGFSTSAVGSDWCDTSGGVCFDLAGAMVSDLFQSVADEHTA